jgi:hypothetical protein
MAPFGLGRKEQPKSFTTDITDKEDLEEIKEIADMLNPNEANAVCTPYVRNKIVYHNSFLIFILV